MVVGLVALVFLSAASPQLVSAQASPTPAPSSVQIIVRVDFTPDEDPTFGEPIGVVLNYTCTSGVVTNNDASAVSPVSSEGQPGSFTVTGFDEGATCSFTEIVPTGYTADESDCAAMAITAGATVTCTLVNVLVSDLPAGGASPNAGGTSVSIALLLIGSALVGAGVLLMTGAYWRSRRS